MTPDPDQVWLDAVEDAVHAAAERHGLDPVDLLDVTLDDDEQPVGAGVDFARRLDPLTDADPADDTFAQAVGDAVAAHAAELNAEAIAAKALEYNDDLHPHKGPGPGGGQFASTNTSSSSSTRGKLTYSGQRQGTGKGGGGSGSRKSMFDPVPAVTATTTLRNDGKGTNDPAAVSQLQQLINDLKLGGLNVNGTYGDSTEAAVKMVQARLGLAPTGNASPALIRRLRDARVLSPCVGSPVAAAAGHDVTPGNDELHHWWVYGKGRARWHTWTELYTQLLEHVTPERAKRMASAWFLERYHYASGSDINRVKHGKPPRGHRVGPG